MTDESKTENTPDETPAIVGFAAGDTVRKTVDPQIAAGIVLAAHDGQAYIVGRRPNSLAWRLIAASFEQLEHVTDDGTETGSWFAAIGEALVDAQREQDTANATRMEQLAEVTERATLAEADRDTARRDLTAFKVQVRDQAISFVDDNSYNVDYLNDEFLVPLGLDRKASRWQVPVDLRATQTVYVTVEATSEDEAKDVVESNYGLNDFDIDHSNWDVDTDWEVDTYSIEETSD